MDKLEAVITGAVERLRLRHPNEDIFISIHYSGEKTNIRDRSKVNELIAKKRGRYHFFGFNPETWLEVTNPVRTAYNTAMIGLVQIFPVPKIGRAIFRHLGAVIGNNGTTGVNSKIDNYFPKLIEIGDRVALGYGSVITSHFSMEPGHICIGSTKIGDNTLVGLESVIGPVNVGKNVRVNARSVVMRNIPDNAIVAGNPARVIGYK